MCSFGFIVARSGFCESVIVASLLDPIFVRRDSAQVWNPFSKLAAKPLRHRGSGISY